MSEIIGRDYCLKHPLQIIRYFGVGVFGGMLLSGRQSLLERVMKDCARRGVALPGFVGKSYRIAALIEYRVSRIYGKMAARFSEERMVRDFYTSLSKEEEEHARLMLLCLYTVAMKPSIQYVPSVRDRAIRTVTERLRRIEKNIDSLTLDEAFDLTESLEKSEINAIFEKLLGQAGSYKKCLFVDKLKEVEGHGATIPRKIRELRQLFSSPASS